LKKEELFAIKWKGLNSPFLNPSPSREGFRERSASESKTSGD